MASFEDEQGRAWHPRITCMTLVCYEEETGVCLLSTGKDIFKGRIGHLLRLAYLACAREAQERGLDFSAFCEALGSTARIQAAGEALAGSLADFFQAKPGKGAATPREPLGTGKTSTP